MAKLPKKIDQEIKPLDLRQFVSSAAQKPASASAVTRINLTMTDDDLDTAQEFQNEYGASRAEVIRAALAALRLVSAEERRRLFDDIRKNSPKAGRPTVNK
ncbi:hypothetical protein ACERYU_004848 [Escherichia coli]|uniref:DMP19 family protein n=1 Tax=Salmonella enterica subsp. enterica serovar Saintpaul TaxID=90105 RepID=A0A5U9BK86_SALET|nr:MULTISPECIES: hypothetical protein [Enterobacteriaceae]EBS0963729.1 hypothetical protein [Salmonella enterica subsp. enterica serovar Saintpaul]ECM1026425.1 hypothetical protein [Salmonella enterica subsp. enterica serovar Give]EDF3649151.1 hypothetical protein [Salmonella enterica subsp. enterica serovar Newport]EDQ8720909.1 hypothetical protein [Salmonella enterica]EFN8570454.1 hypothetical protein [Escherichia coli O85:H32]MED6420317.1 hypothetical protein [Escherichia coli O157]HCS141